MRLGTVLCVFVSLFFYSLISHSQELNVSIVTDEEKKGGYLVEITKESFRRVGYEVHIEYLPWKRALVMSMEQGRYDVLLGAYYSEERAYKMAYSEPVATVEISILTRKEDNISYTRIEDLAPFLIGHINGATVNPEFDLAAKKYLKVDYVSNVDQNIKKLLMGWIDMLVDKKRKIQLIINEKYYESKDGLVFLNPPLEVSYFYNAFPKSRDGYRQKLEDFNEGLRLIIEDGTYDRMLKEIEGS